MLLPDDTLVVDSMFKIIPQVLIELMGSSLRPGFDECNNSILIIR
jgi:hypothetical protein